MAKKRSKPAEGTTISPTTPPAPKGAGRKPVNTVALPPALYRALKQLADRNQRPVLWQARILLQQALEAEGLWPPEGRL